MLMAMPTTISQKFTEAIPLVLGERNGDPVLMRTRAYYRGIPVAGEIWVTGDGIDEVVEQGFLEYVGESEGPLPDPTRATIDEPAAPKDQAKLAAQKAAAAAKRPAKKAVAKKQAPRKSAAAKKAAAPKQEG